MHQSSIEYWLCFSFSKFVFKSIGKVSVTFPRYQYCHKSPIHSDTNDTKILQGAEKVLELF